MVLWGDHLAQGLITRELDCDGRGLVGGIPLFFPGHMPSSFLTQWICHTSVAALEQAHPNQYKKHKNTLAAQATPTRGRQGTLGRRGLGPCGPDSVAKKDAQKSILYLRALRSHRPFPAQLANILKHKPEDSDCLGCTLGIRVHVSPKLDLSLRTGDL